MKPPSWHSLFSLRAGPSDAADVQLSETIERLYTVDADSLARVRRRAMADFRGVFEPPITLRHRQKLLPGRRWLVPLAASLGIAAASVGMAAANDGPGQPFYPVRLAIETWTLPPAGTAARWGAELDRLEARLGEARAAADRQDPSAVAAAFDAYAQELDEVAGDALGPGADPAQLATNLDQDGVVITAMAGALPDGANAAARAALHHVSQAEQSLAGPGNGHGVGPGNGNGPPRTHGP